MRKLLSSLRKEFLILARDLPGLAILFIMPVLLIMVVTLAQKNAMKSSRESKTAVLFLDISGSAFPKMLQENLDSSGLFTVVRTINHIPLNSDIFRELISKGEYPAGISVSEKDSTITLMLDPGLQISFRQYLVTSLSYLIKGTQSRTAIEKLLKTTAPSGMEVAISSMIGSTIKNLTPIRQVCASKKETVIQPSITQNSISGFILFAMFFIVVTLSGSMISDKNEGSFLRLKTLPVGVFTLLSAKVLLYLGVCLIQFLLMFLTGCWILPAFFGIAGLQAGSHFGAVALNTICSALAAVGFGLAVGSAARTHGQAALFGSVTVVILGVISGTFLPVSLMPKFLQSVSMISPIRWGIDNYIDIFLRQGTVLTILPDILLLLLFFILALIFSIAIFARRY